MVKILVIGDLHGIMPKIHFKNFDYMILVGDVCSDKYLRNIKNKWMKYISKNNNDFMSLDEFINLNLKKKDLKKLKKESLKKGREILKYLDSFNKPIFVVPGNWDLSYGNSKIIYSDKNDYNYFKSFLDYWKNGSLNNKLKNKLRNVHDCHLKYYETKEFNILGFGLSSSPEDPKIRKEKNDYTKIQFKRLKKAYSGILIKIRSLYKKINKQKPVIFLSHDVSYNTKLDKIKSSEKMFNNKHYGSSVARWFCEKYQPLLCIGGHIHEGKGKTKIKKTIVINPGFGKNSNVLIEIDDKKSKIKNIIFV